MASMNKISNLKLLREQFNYSQADISTYLGISQPAYQKYESGITEVSIEALEKLARLYGIDEYDILEGNIEQEQIGLAFAFRRKGESDLEDVAHFQQIVKNYIMMCNEIEKNR